MTEEQIRERLVQARVEQSPPVVQEWFGPERLREQMRDFLAGEIERLDRDDLAEAFAHHCPIPGAHPDDYKNQLLELPVLGHALVGIRFWSLDVDRPFVTVVASTRLPENQEELRAAMVALRPSYRAFSPRQIRLFLPAHSPLQPNDAEQYWEKRLVAAPVEQLLAGPRPSGYERVRLERASDTGFYAEYRRAYHELVRVAPSYREYTRLESEEDLAELAQAGTLFEVRVHGRWAGVTAVDEAGEEGLEGYLMIEILLAHLGGSAWLPPSSAT